MFEWGDQEVTEEEFRRRVRMTITNARYGLQSEAQRPREALILVQAMLPEDNQNARGFHEWYPISGTINVEQQKKIAAEVVQNLGFTLEEARELLAKLASNIQSQPV
jgi:hypothetical protein